MLNHLITQYLNIQKQLNLAILLPQYILSYKQNSQYDIVTNIVRDLNNDLASEMFNNLVNEKVFITKSLFIEKLIQWQQDYFDKEQIEQQRLAIVKQINQLSITPQVQPLVITNDLFLLQLAQLEYDKHNLSQREQCLLVQGFYQYYEQASFIPEVQIINGNDIESGLELSCYLLNKSVAVFAFRGSQTKFFQTMSEEDFQQSRLDWQYNLKAIVQGTETSQYQKAIQFIEHIKQKYCDIQHYFATGHSLGGHLVQLIQIVNHSFDDYVVFNSSPLQLKQLFLIAPNKFTSSQWQQLFAAPNKEDLITQWHSKNTGRIYQYASDLINIVGEIPQTFYYGQLIYLPSQAYFHYQPYLQQCFTSSQLLKLTTLCYHALNIKKNKQYDIVVDLLQTILFELLSHDKWCPDDVQLIVSLLKYLQLNNWLSIDSYDKCLALLQQYQQSFDLDKQLNYLKRTTLIMQLQFQMYKGLNIELLKAIASMHRLSGHWLALEEREINERFY